MTPAGPPCPEAPPGRPAVRSQVLAVAGVAMLVALGVAWELWLAPTGRGTWSIKVLPLVAMMPGLLRHRLQTFRGLSLLVWLYVGEGLVRGTTETGLSRSLAAAQTLLALLLFGVCVQYIRGRPAARST